MSYSAAMSRRNDLREPWLLVIALLSFGAVGLAVLLQFVFDMQPCAWCVFQRLLFLLVGALALLGWTVSRAAAARRVLAGLALLAALGGLWAALHQQFVAAQSQSCAFTFADRVMMKSGLDESLPWLFQATASCADANAPLLGLPFAYWSAALFVLLALMAARVLFARRS
ncbi:MAG: disulfide bond formation protein B [Burkholderiaceae bacterium]